MSNMGIPSIQLVQRGKNGRLQLSSILQNIFQFKIHRIFTYGSFLPMAEGSDLPYWHLNHDSDRPFPPSHDYCYIPDRVSGRL